MPEKWDLEKDRAFKKKESERVPTVDVEPGNEKICINWWDAYERRGLDPEVARLEIGLKMLKYIWDAVNGTGAFERDFIVTKKTSENKPYNILCIEGTPTKISNLLFYVYCDISIPLMIGEEWMKRTR